MNHTYSGIVGSSGGGRHWKLLAGCFLLLPAFAGRLEADTFIRGDPNLDSRIDISDPVAILNCLFQGLNCTTCDDAADSNDDGSVDLSDAVYSLGFSFLGGPMPPDRRDCSTRS